MKTDPKFWILTNHLGALNPMTDISSTSSDWKIRIGLRLARVKLRALRREKPISINRAIGAATALIACLPAAPDETLPAAQMIRDLATVLDIHQIAFVVRADRMHALSDDFSPRGMIPYSEEEIGFFGLPKKGLVTRVTARSWDLALDLHRPFDLATAFLCASSRAKVRIGFRTPHWKTPPFFNLEYDLKSPDKSPKEVYDALTRFIEGLCPLRAVRSKE